MGGLFQVAKKMYATTAIGNSIAAEMSTSSTSKALDPERVNISQHAMRTQMPNMIQAGVR